MRKLSGVSEIAGGGVDRVAIEESELGVKEAEKVSGAVVAPLMVILYTAALLCNDVEQILKEQHRQHRLRILWPTSNKTHSTHGDREDCDGLSDHFHDQNLVPTTLE